MSFMTLQTAAAKRRWALALALLVTAYIAVADWVFLPLHRLGYAQGVLGYLDGLSAMLQAPGFAVVLFAGWRQGHHTTTGLWFILVPINFVLWVVGLRLALGILFASGFHRRTNVTPAKGEQGELREGHPSACSRRAVLTGAARLAAVGAGCVGAYSFLLEPRRFEIVRQTRHLRGLHPELQGLRLVQLTDIHHGPNLSLDYVRQVIAAANALHPDITLLTGDYVYRSPRYIAPVVRELSELRAKIGIIGVLGNHDWWEDAELTRREFARIGIPLIDNDRMILTPDRRLERGGRAQEGLCIAGIGDYLEDTVNFDAALRDVPETMPRLLLSHNPDAAEDADLIARRYRIDLMMCGHTHGGQAWIPGLGRPVVPSRYGQKYAYGSVRGPTCDVYVCSGIGTSILPMRFCVPPEINVIELTPS
jgi:predicted MPP superfamily phosphohydrolase